MIQKHIHAFVYACMLKCVVNFYEFLCDFLLCIHWIMLTFMMYLDRSLHSHFVAFQCFTLVLIEYKTEQWFTSSEVNQLLNSRVTYTFSIIKINLTFETFILLLMYCNSKLFSLK